MTDDIVTRLRNTYEDNTCCCHDDPFWVCSYCQLGEAADEIERLRADRDQLANVLFDYTMEVAALRSQIHNFHRQSEFRTEEDWRKQLYSYSYNCSTPDYLFVFMERYRSRGISRDQYADRRSSNE